MDTDVLVIGAGPTGLTLAASLLRRNADVLVVDRLAAGANTSRAAAVNAPALGAQSVAAKLNRTLGLTATAFLFAGPETVQVTPPATRATGCNDPSFLCLGEVATATQFRWVFPSNTALVSPT